MSSEPDPVIKSVDRVWVAGRLPAMMAPKEGSARVRAVRHDIREGLQQMILTGERQPGTKLRQQELAVRFGVAQGVIREALLELKAYGLVETIDNRGVFVSQIRRQTLLDSFEVREVHEGLAARLCCERATRVDLRKLDEMAGEIYRLGLDEKWEEMGSLDRQFHATIIELSGNGMLLRLAQNYRLLGKIVRANRPPKLVHGEHVGIIKAIQSGDANLAEQLIRKHVAAARQALEASFINGTFAPTWVT